MRMKYEPTEAAGYQEISLIRVFPLLLNRYNPRLDMEKRSV